MRPSPWIAPLPSFVGPPERSGSQTDFNASQALR